MSAADLMAAVHELMSAAGLPLETGKEELLGMAARLREQLHVEQQQASEVRCVILLLLFKEQVDADVVRMSCRAWQHG